LTFVVSHIIIEQDNYKCQYIYVKFEKNICTDDRYIVNEGTVAICNNEFMGRDDLLEIVIPKSVKYICGAAFYMCKNLKIDNHHIVSKLPYHNYG